MEGGEIISLQEMAQQSRPSMVTALPSQPAASAPARWLYAGGKTMNPYDRQPPSLGCKAAGGQMPWVPGVQDPPSPLPVATSAVLPQSQG